MKNAYINSFISVEFFAAYAGETTICISKFAIGSIIKKGSKWAVTVQENQLGETKTLAAAKELAIKKMQEICETIEAVTAQEWADIHADDSDAQVIYYFTGHDAARPKFDRMTVAEYNARFDTNYPDAGTITEEDAEYAFSEEDAAEWLAEAADPEAQIEENTEEEARETEQAIAEFATPEGVVKFMGYPSAVQRRVELNADEVGDVYQYPDPEGITYYPKWGEELDFSTLEQVAEFVSAAAKKRRIQNKAHEVSYAALKAYGFYGNHAFISAVLEQYGEDKINLEKIAHQSVEIELGIDIELGDKVQGWHAADWEAAALFLINKGGRISTDVQPYIAPKLGIQALIFHAQSEQYYAAVLAYHQEIKERIQRIFNIDFLLAIQLQIMQLDNCKAFEHNPKRIGVSAANIAETFINHLAKLGAS